MTTTTTPKGPSGYVYASLGIRAWSSVLSGVMLGGMGAVSGLVAAGLYKGGVAPLEVANPALASTPPFDNSLWWGVAVVMIIAPWLWLTWWGTSFGMSVGQNEPLSVVKRSDGTRPGVLTAALRLFAGPIVIVAAGLWLSVWVAVAVAVAGWVLLPLVSRTRRTFSDVVSDSALVHVNANALRSSTDKKVVERTFVARREGTQHSPRSGGVAALAVVLVAAMSASVVGVARHFQPPPGWTASFGAQRLGTGGTLGLIGACAGVSLGVGAVVYALGKMWTTRSEHSWVRGDSRWWILATLIGLCGYVGGIFGGYGGGALVIAGAYVLTHRTKAMKTA